MMRVREHINEKFIEDSDPIHDMGIGPLAIIKNCIKNIEQADNSNKNFLMYNWTLKNWKKDDGQLLRGINVYYNNEIYSNKPITIFKVLLYSNEFKKSKSTKKIDKIKYVKSLLSKANILLFMEDEYEISSTATVHSITEIYFTVKDECTSFFDKIKGSYLF